MPNRHRSTDEYRYGFNGKEKDDEIKGEGLQYDYGFRIYDPRISKFLSQDPLFKGYPWYSPYQFAGNKPIAAIDLDGLEEVIVIQCQTVDGRVLRETLDYKTLLKKVEYVGYKDSAKFSEITVKEYENYKRTYWDAFSNQPKLFGSGYNEYTIGMQKSSSKDFTGLYKGTLTISSFGSNIYITYTGSSATNKTSTLKIIKDAFDEKKNPEMVKGINTAKNYVAGVSLAVSGPALLSGQAGIIGYSGAASDVDQLTGTSEKLTENYPKAKTLINGAKLTLDLMSLKGNFSDLLNLNKVTPSKATSTLQETILGISNTTGDSQETLFND